MFSSKKWATLLAVVVILSMVLAACGPTQEPATTVLTEKETVIVEQPGQTVKETVVVKETQVVQVEVTAVPEAKPERTGGWVDTIVFTSQDSAEAAVKQIQAGDMDVYAYSVSDAQLFETIKADPKLGYTSGYGSYTELTFNPSGPTFIDGRLNPFSNAKIREAMNWLVDRDYMVSEIYGGLGKAKLTTLNSAFPDYAKYVDVARELEAKYAYNPDKAKEVITTEMTAMGATQGADGKWQFNGAPVTIIAIIRTEDERRQIGDYICNQLETVGFATDRQYKTRSEASPIWNQSDPAEGKMHFYTGGWITTAVSRDDATNFAYFYTPLGSTSPLWQAYVNTPEYLKVAEALWVNDFKTIEERGELFREALRLSLEDSTRVWLVDQISFSPQRADLQVAYDLAGGVAGSQLWASTIRLADQEGGTLRIAQPGILVEPWNNLFGSNWIYDSMPQRATTDFATVSDPYTGLVYPNRIEKADISVVEGLPVGKTLDWLTLQFVPSIEVPGDAWVDWDATNQKWITAAEKYTQTQTANAKIVVTYPADLFEKVTWHDGTKLSMADFVMGMIMTWDPGKAESAIFDESYVPVLDAFTSHFKGVRVVSTNPLTIESYDDQFYLDAEYMVRTWYPAGAVYNYGGAPWQVMAIGYFADAAGKLAFSTDKAGTKEVEWMSFIAGPSLQVLRDELATATMSGTIPYAPTMSEYVTAEQAQEAYGNLDAWYRLQGHFWVGAGPYWLDKAFPTEKTLTLRRFEGYPDKSAKWSGFGTPAIPVVEIDGPGQLAIGTEGAYDVFVTFNDAPYAAADIAAVKYLVFDSTGALVGQGDAAAAEEGHYTITLPTDVTSKLAAGSNKLEVVVTSKTVSIPAIEDLEFVTQ